MDNNVSRVYRGRSAAQRKALRKAARDRLGSLLLLSGEAGLGSWGIRIEELSANKDGGRVRIIGPCGEMVAPYEFLGCQGWGLSAWLIPFSREVVSARAVLPCLGFSFNPEALWRHDLIGSSELEEFGSLSVGHISSVFLMPNGDTVQVRTGEGWLSVEVRVRELGGLQVVMSLDAYLKQVRSQ